MPSPVWNTLKRAGASVALVAAVALPFHPWSQAARGAASFEATIHSSQSGIVRIFYDVGKGFNEGDVAESAVIAGEDSVVRAALPLGRLNALRLDLLSRDSEMSLREPRISAGGGQVLARLDPGQFRPLNQIAKISARDGRLEIASAPHAGAAQLGLFLSPPLPLPANRHWLWLPVAALAMFAVLGLLERGTRPGGALRRVGAAAGARAAARPGLAILASALLGTLIASYPIIFAGKSLVSPNMNTALLYGVNPYVPGYQSLERANANSADIDALMWDQVPFSMIEHQALLRDHELPLWNRYNSAGTPLLGQGQSCFGDPLQLLPILANGAAWAWDLKFLLAKFGYALGIGLCVWRLGAQLPATLLVTFTAQFIGFFVYRVNHPAIFSLCYSPWILYFWIRIVASPRLATSFLWIGALIGANAVEMSSGTVKEAYILLLSLNFSGLCLFLAGDRRLAIKARLLGALVLGAVAFALITAPVWLTFYRALGNSHTTYDAAQTFQLQPGMLVGLFDEAFFRPFQYFTNVINPSANFVILLGMAWLTVRWRSVAPKAAVGALLISLLPAAALVFGVVPPALVGRVPFLGNILHIDNTFSCVLIVVLTVLSGVGWKAAWETVGTPEGRSDSPKVISLLVLIYLAYLGTAQAVVRTAHYDYSWGWFTKIGPFVHYYGLSLLIASGLLLWALGRLRSPEAGSSLALAAGLLAFAALQWRHGLQLGMAEPDYVIMPADRVDLVAASPTVATIREDQEDNPSRSIGFVDNFFPGWSAAYGLEGISGPDALMNRYYRELMEVSKIERIWDWRYRLQDADLKAVQPMLDLLNVRFYLDYPAGQRTERPSLVPLLSADMEVYESRASWPRAFFTDSVAVYHDLPQLWSWIRAGDGRPFASIQRNDWLKFDPVPSVSGNLGTRRLEAARDYHLTTNSTSFSVHATGPGFIVLSEAYEFENFHAFLDGKRVPYFRTNHAFKGLYVPSAGDHRVRFSYWPKYLSLCLGLSGAACLLTLAALACAFRASRQGPPVPAVNA